MAQSFGSIDIETMTTTGRLGIMLWRAVPLLTPRRGADTMGMAAPTYWTAEMVRQLPDDGNRYEVVYGELLVTPAPRLGHQLLVSRLSHRLAEYLSREPVGIVLTSPADISWGRDDVSAGTVDEWGIEVGSDVSLTRALTFSASYTWYNADIQNDLVGNVLSTNTPRNKGTISLAYAGRQGLDVAVDARLVAGYHWTTGAWDGDIPASQIVSLSAGYRINPHIRLYANATNLFDQPRFDIYGGSVNAGACWWE